MAGLGGHGMAWHGMAWHGMDGIEREAGMAGRVGKQAGRVTRHGRGGRHGRG
jgi:hypothetical protein